MSVARLFKVDTFDEDMILVHLPSGEMFLLRPPSPPMLMTFPLLSTVLSVFSSLAPFDAPLDSLIKEK